MKNFIKLIIITCLTSSTTFGQLFSTQSGETSFFSETPVENISGVNKTVGAILNTSTKEIAVSMKMTAFDFPNKLMQEHFNENYIESDKFPTGLFKGKIVEDIDLTKNGTYDVTAKGQLTLHGITQAREIKGKLTVDNQKITLTSNFDVKLVDHKIDVPKLVFSKIAEVIAVKSKYIFSPYVKK
ncbi:YceI-like domain-containing protein [Arcicella aurantiaca]|uniref:YceI-like domain-containing protein n=1 Tax=Arcicella aurantiaca TaxID=591202 RepID=A0A316EW40_9BACT|nr:YceI family protein [Arcicella aurantiaca]PWK27381.1 YceI-like domain-containing protein [Arcicella aurantiaca]